ncbi:uncharacterized protein LOC105698984 [Orussus abietinus]|uniref:uncharacterized protein LOC105698984 n=1 Tax=Orussus abietinus TaxID=222816 RepID=UPI00062664C7|nr:uncharacterized protein LOC105698984 [Orussus abietinus]
MPGIDWIPGVSQVKALAQAVTGDTEGAMKTMENFCRECPGVSQVTSVVQLAAGDAEGALETQKICLGTVNNVANGIPVIGHAKGIIHHAVGDPEGGNQAFNAATRSTVVISSGAAACIATGGIGAIPAGIAAGVGYDATASAISGEDQGYIAALKNAADNPSAGAFIDALAIPVGDGLAGYSGGQIANKIQLNHLESLRAAKLDRIDAAGTSGEALQLGREANALTSKINTIKYGTPHFWDDAKSGTVVSEASTSNVAIPVVVGPEDALYHDSYVEVIITENNRKEAQKRMYERDKQTPERSISQAYKDVKFISPETLSDLLESTNGDPNRDPNREPNNNLKECVSQLISWSWLALIMPKEFPYTAVTQLNSCHGGLYHSFIRHINEWAQVIPSDLSRVIDRLSPLMAEINDVASANNEFDAAEARNAFLQARRRLNRETYNDLQVALVEIQMTMHRFIQENITFDNYQGRSVNTNGGERLYFKVETEVGPKAMVICLTNERFEPRTGDRRPIRMLLTVFFEPWNVFKSHGMLETKKEMQKKTQK